VDEVRDGRETLMGDTVIRVDNISKKFCRRLRYIMMYGTLDVARGMLGVEAKTDRLRQGEFWALEDVSLELKRGETLGLIGPNGSGKSTLLRLLNGIYMPDKGRIEINGRVGALIAVGAGFHPLMTGRENIYLNGSILGMTKADIDARFDRIVDFADIGEFLDAPVKTYSSGMYVRLGFSIAVHCEPDILLVDEVLAVGDAQFQKKCFDRIRSLKEAGATIILVTHSMDSILKHTRSAVLLDRGRLIAEGRPDEVGNYYTILQDSSGAFPDSLDIEDRKPAGGTREEVSRSSSTGRAEGHDGLERRYRSRPAYNSGEKVFGSGHAGIIDFELIDADGKERNTVRTGELLRFRFEVVFHKDVKVPNYGFLIQSKDGIEVYGMSTLCEGISVDPKARGERAVVEFSQHINLTAGDYFINFGVEESTAGGVYTLEGHLDMAHLKVLSAGSPFGIADLFSRFEVTDGRL